MAPKSGLNRCHYWMKVIAHAAMKVCEVTGCVAITSSKRYPSTVYLCILVWFGGVRGLAANDTQYDNTQLDPYNGGRCQSVDGN